jgi:PilZ domain
MDQFSYDPLNALSADDFTGQRAGARDSLMLTAQLRIEGRPEIAQVRVRNLSSGGMMAEYAAPVSSGTSLEVEVRGVGWITGRIAWSAEGRVGVAFDHDIDPMLARKPVGKGGGPATGFVKPIITRR